MPLPSLPDGLNTAHWNQNDHCTEREQHTAVSPLKPEESQPAGLHTKDSFTAPLSNPLLLEGLPFIPQHTHWTSVRSSVLELLTFSKERFPICCGHDFSSLAQGKHHCLDSLLCNTNKYNMQESMESRAHNTKASATERNTN